MIKHRLLGGHGCKGRQHRREVGVRAPQRLFHPAQELLLAVRRLRAHRLVTPAARSCSDVCQGSSPVANQRPATPRPDAASSPPEGPALLLRPEASHGAPWRGGSLRTARSAGARELCGWAHGELIYVHPFADGNSRMARSLVLWLGARYGLPVFLDLRPRPSGPSGYEIAAKASMTGRHQLMRITLTKRHCCI
jgi:Fic/DOC family